MERPKELLQWTLNEHGQDAGTKSGHLSIVPTPLSHLPMAVKRVERNGLANEERQELTWNFFFKD